MAKKRRVLSGQTRTTRKPSNKYLKRIQSLFVPILLFYIGIFGIKFHKSHSNNAVIVEFVGVGSVDASLQEFLNLGRQPYEAPVSHSSPTASRLNQKIQSVNRTQIDIGIVIETTFEDAEKTINFQYNQSYDTFYNIPSDGTNLWDDTSSSAHGNGVGPTNGVFHIQPTSNIPKWMKDYFNWHKSKLQKLRSIHEPSNITEVEKLMESERWLVMQCLHYDRKCGGTADRIKPILYMLRVAYESRRILFIRWEKPNLLEEFLVPPVGGFDWRVPPWLGNVLRNSTIGRRSVPDEIIREYVHWNITLMRTRYQSYNGGAQYYNSRLGQDELDFSNMFSTVWNIFFTPSPKIKQRIVEELDLYQLVPHHYSASHLRALYSKQDRPKEQIFAWTEALLKCASRLPQTIASTIDDEEKGSEYKIFFTSDSEIATQYSEQIASQRNIFIVNRRNTTSPSPPLHLDKPKDWNKRPVSDFYDTFIDLYIIALSGCVSYNKGGFSHWGLLIGGNLTCTHPIKRNGGGPPISCDWSPTFPTRRSDQRPSIPTKTNAADLFLPEMEYRWDRRATQ